MSCVSNNILDINILLLSFGLLCCASLHPFWAAAILVPLLMALPAMEWLSAVAQIPSMPLSVVVCPSLLPGDVVGAQFDEQLALSIVDGGSAEFPTTGWNNDRCTTFGDKIVEEGVGHLHHRTRTRLVD